MKHLPQKICLEKSNIDNSNLGRGNESLSEVIALGKKLEFPLMEKW